MIGFFLRNWWKRRQRQIDRKILWPSLNAAMTRYTAEEAFIQHMIMDPAYSDWSIEDMREYVSELP